MAIFTWKPQTATRKSKPRVHEAKFGDGYSQRVEDGINNNPASWSLTFQQTELNMAPLISFIEARKGSEAFDWTPPIGTAGRYVCRECDTDVVALGVHKLSCTFEQVFGV